VLEKRSAIKPPQTLFTIEHDGNILSAGRLYRTETSESTRGLIQGPVRVQTVTQLEPPHKPSSTGAAAAAPASGGPTHNIASDKQIPTTPQVPSEGNDGMRDQGETAPTISQQPPSTDEMQKIFAQLEEGMEEMDRNFRVHELQRNAGVNSNER
jgi:hypothetical protein